MGRSVGIDFGRWNGRAAAVTSGRPAILLNRLNQPATVACLGLAEDGRWVPGRTLQGGFRLKTDRTASDFLGVLAEGKSVAIGGTLHDPVELASVFLKKLAEDAAHRLSEPVTDAVVTTRRPAPGDLEGRLRAAAEMAGFRVSALVDGAAAAAASYISVSPSPPVASFLVIDVGWSGTSAAAFVADPPAEWKEHFLGDWSGFSGEIMTRSLVRCLLEDVRKATGIDPAMQRIAATSLEKQAERGKQALDLAGAFGWALVGELVDSRGGRIDAEGEVSRTRYDEEIRPAMEPVLDGIEASLQGGSGAPSGPERILLVGLGSRTACFRDACARRFGAGKIVTPDQPGDWPALGAAWLASGGRAPIRIDNGSRSDAGPAVEGSERSTASVSGEALPVIPVADPSGAQPALSEPESAESSALAAAAAPTPAFVPIRYRILDPLARATSHRVVRAQEEDGERAFRLRLYAAVDAGARTAFSKAFLAVHLHHPHLEPILDFGRIGAEFFLATPGDGLVSLREWLVELGPSARMPVRFSLELAAGLMEGVECLHEHRLMHGGIRPENVLCDPSSRHAVLGGFESMEWFGREDPGPPFPEHLPYTAPEALAGRRDQKSDLYAAAALLYELLTGAPPFRETDPAKLRHQIATAPPPRVTERNPRVPENLAALVAQGLARDPEERRLRAADLRELLTPPTAVGPTGATAPAEARN
jgi:serine/threonine-protein kinase